MPIRKILMNCRNYLITCTNGKKMRNFIYIGGAIVALYLLGRARLAKNVKIVFRGLSFAGGLVRPSLNLRFGIQNPTDQTAEIRSIVGTVQANGKTVADVNTFIAVKLAPNSEAIIPVKAEPSALGIASTVWQYLQSTQREKLSIKFSGTANVDGVNFPIETTAAI